MKINNTDTAKASAFIEEVRADPKKAIKKKKSEANGFLRRESLSSGLF